MASGFVRFRFSLQPSCSAPPKSSAERDRSWMAVPMAPSTTRIRSWSILFSFSIRSLLFIFTVFRPIWPGRGAEGPAQETGISLWSLPKLQKIVRQDQAPPQPRATLRACESILTPILNLPPSRGKGHIFTNSEFFEELERSCLPLTLSQVYPEHSRREGLERVPERCPAHMVRRAHHERGGEGGSPRAFSSPLKLRQTVRQNRGCLNTESLGTMRPLEAMKDYKRGYTGLRATTFTLATSGPPPSWTRGSPSWVMAISTNPAAVSRPR